MRRLKTLTVSALAMITLALSGCAAETEDPDYEFESEQIAQELEKENGGLNMADEVAYFGDATELEDATLTELPFDDAIANDQTVLSMKQKPDAVVFHTTVLWGQFPLNWDNKTPRNWSGVLTVNRGAMVVGHTVAFEGKTDNMLPRPNPQTVAFTSATLPHVDGMRLAIIDPDPLNTTPLTLTYATPNGPVFSAPIKALTNGPQSKVVDEAGNRIVAISVPQPVDLCNFGMLGGRWHRVAEGRGRLMGPVADAKGDMVGHVRGIYGKRANGNKVFFGKYINKQGMFMGIFAGNYNDGHFEGRWLHRAGEIGKLGGEYRETIPGPETGGHFLGRWAETSCNLPVGPGSPLN